MAKFGRTKAYRFYADRFYLDRANRDTYLARQAVGDLLTSGHIHLPTKLVKGLDAPGADGDAARKKYVDDLVALYLPLAGGAITGDVTVTSGKTIDGVDISAHAVDYALHTLLVPKTADETLTNDATLQNDDELFFALGANEVWFVEALLYRIGKAAADIKFKAVTPSGSSGKTWRESDRASELVVSTTYAEAIETDDTLGVGKYYWFVVNGATAGNFQLQWAQNTQNNSDLTVKAGSFLRATRII